MKLGKCSNGQSRMRLRPESCSEDLTSDFPLFNSSVSRAAVTHVCIPLHYNRAFPSAWLLSVGGVGAFVQIGLGQNRMSASYTPSTHKLLDLHLADDPTLLHLCSPEEWDTWGESSLVYWPRDPVQSHHTRSRHSTHPRTSPIRRSQSTPRSLDR
jgi:hypothetical protein